MWPMGLLFFPNAKRLLKDYGGKDILCCIENNGDIDSSVTMAFKWGILRGGKLERSLCFTFNSIQSSHVHSENQFPSVGWN